MTLTRHCCVAFALRILLVIYANYHDEHFQVSYTDVDYKVFTDAARLVTQGKSPYDRHTYRYPPFLAALLTPNVLLHRNFGKILFCAIDIVVGLLIKRILSQRWSDDKANDCACLWLYNPLTLIVSTRGNADSLAVLPVIAALYSVQRGKPFQAGLFHGLAIHFRLYPIAFSLVMYLSLRTRNVLLPNSQQTKLVLSCLLSLGALTLISYRFYGYDFVWESFLYHLTRKDPRHNFSVYFLMLYLSEPEGLSVVCRFLMFLPQLLLVTVLSFVYATKEKLPFAMLCQAMVMVFYNPVLTSQYFFWFLSLLPLSLPNIRFSKRRSLCLIGAWIGSQALWLFAAYLLEFRSVNTFVPIWIASLLFFAVNVKILSDVIKFYNVCK